MRLVFDRRIVLAAVSAAAVLLCIALVASSVSLRAERDGLKARQKEMALLKDEYLLRKGAVAAVEGRQSPNITGVAQGIDEIFRSLGLNQKVKSVKSVGSSDQRFGSVEEAEVLVEKVNMNELVNILHKVENGPLPLTVKKAAMRTSFENPALLNLTFTAGLIKPK